MDVQDGPSKSLFSVGAIITRLFFFILKNMFGIGAQGIFKRTSGMIFSLSILGFIYSQVLSNFYYPSDSNLIFSLKWSWLIWMVNIWIAHMLLFLGNRQKDWLSKLWAKMRLESGNSSEIKKVLSKLSSLKAKDSDSNNEKVKIQPSSCLFTQTRERVKLQGNRLAMFSIYCAILFAALNSCLMILGLYYESFGLKDIFADINPVFYQLPVPLQILTLVFTVFASLARYFCPCLFSVFCSQIYVNSKALLQFVQNSKGSQSTPINRETILLVAKWYDFHSELVSDLDLYLGKFLRANILLSGPIIAFNILNLTREFDVEYSGKKLYLWGTVLSWTIISFLNLVSVLVIASITNDFKSKFMESLGRLDFEPDNLIATEHMDRRLVISATSVHRQLMDHLHVNRDGIISVFGIEISFALLFTLASYLVSAVVFLQQIGSPQVQVKQ